MNNHSPTSFTAESNLTTRKQEPTESIPAWAWVALIGAGLVLVVLGLVQEFTTVTCRPVGESNGVPIVPTLVMIGLPTSLGYVMSSSAVAS